MNKMMMIRNQKSYSVCRVFGVILLFVCFTVCWLWTIVCMGLCLEEKQYAPLWSELARVWLVDGHGGCSFATVMSQNSTAQHGASEYFSGFSYEVYLIM